MKKLSKDELKDYLKEWHLSCCHEGTTSICHDKMYHGRKGCTQAFFQTRQLIETQEPSEKKLEEFVEEWLNMILKNCIGMTAKVWVQYLKQMLKEYDELK